MQGVGNQLPGVEEQETAGWGQYGVGDAGSGVGGRIHDVHELIEKPTTVGLDHNKQMPRNIE